MEARTTKELIHWFGSVQAGEYWNTHYHFHKKSPEKIKVLGHSFLHLMLINTIAPFFYLYGSKRKKQVWIDRAIDWVASIEAEKNKIIRNWKSIGLSVTHAGHSQGLIHLKRQYCDKKACLNCGIGHQIMSLSDNSGQDKYTIDKTTKIHSK
jgi:hypothetical protein